MTDALIPVFEGKELRTLEHDGEIWIPLTDITNAWGIDRSTPDNIINRNKEVFDGLSRSVFDVTSNSSLKCLNERGLYLMMGKVVAGRAKNPEAKSTIIRFQKWYPELIQKYRKGTIQAQLPAPDPIADSLIRNAKYREILIKNYEFTPEQATMITLQHVEKETGYTVERPGIVRQSEEGWLNPTQIGQECGGLTAREVNMRLYNLKFQYPQGPQDSRIWRLTEIGERYGEEYQYELTNKHTEIRIRWHRDVLVAAGFKRAPEQAPIIVA